MHEILDLLLFASFHYAFICDHLDHHDYIYTRYFARYVYFEAVNLYQIRLFDVQCSLLLLQYFLPLQCIYSTLQCFPLEAFYFLFFYILLIKILLKPIVKILANKFICNVKYATIGNKFNLLHRNSNYFAGQMHDLQ